jgi:hypothetical protein
MMEMPPEDAICQGRPKWNSCAEQGLAPHLWCRVCQEHTAESDAPDFRDPEVRGRILDLGDEAAWLLVERDRLAGRLLAVEAWLSRCPVNTRPIPPGEGR